MEEHSFLQWEVIDVVNPVSQERYGFFRWARWGLDVPTVTVFDVINGYRVIRQIGSCDVGFEGVYTGPDLGE
jgi:hypothetical protein